MTQENKRTSYSFYRNVQIFLYRRLLQIIQLVFHATHHDSVKGNTSYLTLMIMNIFNLQRPQLRPSYIIHLLRHIPESYSVQNKHSDRNASNKSSLHCRYQFSNNLEIQDTYNNLLLKNIGGIYLHAMIKLSVVSYR